jgi:hypothetical protein
MKFNGLNARFGGAPARARQNLPGEAASLAALGAHSAGPRP